jgi:hypothetical protein
MRGSNLGRKLYISRINCSFKWSYNGWRTVQLGGILNEDTTIDGNGYNLQATDMGLTQFSGTDFQGIGTSNVALITSPDGFGMQANSRYYIIGKYFKYG